jgi:hypothetical protein
MATLPSTRCQRCRAKRLILKAKLRAAMRYAKILRRLLARSIECHIRLRDAIAFQERTANAMVDEMSRDFVLLANHHSLF